MSLDYFLPLQVPFAKNWYVRQFQLNVSKTRKHVSRNLHSAYVLDFSNVSQFCHTGIEHILTRIWACGQWQQFREGEQANTRLTSASNSSKGQILRTRLNWMGPFDTLLLLFLYFTSFSPWSLANEHAIETRKNTVRRKLFTDRKSDKNVPRLGPRKKVWRGIFYFRLLLAIWLSQ